MKEKITLEELERRLFLGEEKEENLLERYPELLEELGAREAQRVEALLTGQLNLDEISEEELEKLKEWIKKK